MYLIFKLCNRTAKMMGNKKYFDYPKPVGLIERIIDLYAPDESLVLDMFSGSATTAEATMKKNAEDSGNRKFIMIQLPETLDAKSDGYKDGYRTIPDIAEERIRRAGEKILSEHEDLREKLDVGFKVYELNQSNIRQWDENPVQFNEQLELFATSPFNEPMNLFESNPFTDYSSSDARALEIALKSGISLDINPTIENEIYYFVSANKEVFVVLDEYDENIFDKLDKKRKLPVATVILRELDNGSELKFNLVETLKQNEELNNHLNVEWL